MSLLFNLISVFMIIFSLFVLFFMIKDSEGRPKTKRVDVGENISAMKAYFLDKNTSCEKLSEVASALCSAGYFLVHMLINKGENYDDKMQAKGYRESLTRENLELINSIEGHYE